MYDSDLVKIVLELAQSAALTEEDCLGDAALLSVRQEQQTALLEMQALCEEAARVEGYVQYGKWPQELDSLSRVVTLLESYLENDEPPYDDDWAALARVKGLITKVANIESMPNSKVFRRMAAWDVFNENGGAIFFSLSVEDVQSDLEIALGEGVEGTYTYEEINVALQEVAESVDFSDECEHILESVRTQLEQNAEEKAKKTDDTVS